MANYQPMQNPITSTVDIGDFIAKLRQSSKENDQKRAEFLLRQESSNRDQARLDEMLRSDREKEQYQRANSIADILPRLKSMATPGSPDYDPETMMSIAKAKGISLSQIQPPSPGPAPVAPQAPVRASTEYGPRETPEIAAHAAELRSSRGLDSPTTVRGFAPGMIEAGNLDLANRPTVHNADGSTSTVRSMSFADRPGGPETLIPTVAHDGSGILSEDDAIRQYERTGKFLGRFNNPDNATAYAGRLHEQQAMAGTLRDNQAQAEAERQRFARANETDQEFAGRQADYRGQLAQFQPQQAAFQAASKRLPTYSGQSPIGQVDIDPNSAIATREERLRIQRDQLSPLGQIPGAEKMQPAIQAMIAAGMPGSEVAKFVSEATKENQADATKSMYNLTAADQNRHNQAMERAAMLAAGAREHQASGNDANRNDMAANRNMNTYLGTVKEFENNAGIKADVGMMKNIGKIHEELTGSPASPIAQAAAIDTIAQIAQGGKASQGVMNQINAHALGPIESAYDRTYQLTHNGAHSPAWVKSMSDTLGGLKNYAAQEQGRVMQGFEAAAGDTSPFSGPEYSGMRDSQRRKIAASLGMDVPQPRQDEPGAIRPGTGKRPNRSERPANPIMDARGSSRVKEFEDKYGF